MLAAQRQATILDRVRADGGVRVADLVGAWGVSDMTIRRDIEKLAGRGLLRKVHGGAIAASGSVDEPGYAVKSGRQRAEKAAIAELAAPLVGPGTAIGISAGTTTAALAARLLDVRELTVVTNSIPVADLFFRGGRPDQTVVVTGGTRTPSDALVGPVAREAVSRLNLDALFLGVHGFSERGFTTPNLAEAATDEALIAAARQVIVLADHTKWGVIGVAAIAPLAAADVLVTDDGLPSDARRAVRSAIGRVLAARTGGGHRGGAHEPDRAAATEGTR